jgi:uridylate kinase
MKVVISIGGSVFASPELDVEYIKKFSALIKKLSEKNEIKIVVGGGRPSRAYIQCARKLGASERICDELGIKITKMNAMLLCIGLGIKISSNLNEACKSGLIVMGGIEPGQTTDTVAAQLAASCNADLLINATDVDGIYDSDPKQNPYAKKYATLTSKELLEIVGQEHRAGLRAIIDPSAAKLIHENKIKTIVINGKKLENIENAMKGKYAGTLII